MAKEQVDTTDRSDAAVLGPRVAYDRVVGLDTKNKTIELLRKTLGSLGMEAYISRRPSQSS